MPNTDFANSSMFVAFAESLGEALGRGVARGINSSLNRRQLTEGAPTMERSSRGPGRPARFSQQPATSSDKRCKASGCTNPARSKGLCSKHYQAERRRQLRA